MICLITKIHRTYLSSKDYGGTAVDITPTPVTLPTPRYHHLHQYRQESQLVVRLLLMFINFPSLPMSSPKSIQVGTAFLTNYLHLSKNVMIVFKSIPQELSINWSFHNQYDD